MIRFFHSIRDALRGIRFVVLHEQNFRIQLAAAIAAIAAAILLRLRPLEAAAVFFLVLVVLVLELINSAMEKTLDILKPRLEHQVKIAKDIMAATVLLSALASIVIGSIIFWPYIVAVFGNH